MRYGSILVLILTALGAASMPHSARAEVGVSVNLDLFGAPQPPSAPPPAVIAIAPPPIPIYVVPPPPFDGYIWAPGHWRWGGYGYFWVPGTWVQPPMVGYLWTPGYWGWREGVFAWHEGYWGEHIGFYGGINYGGGYGGAGFNGGGWNNGHYFVNRGVVNVPNIVNGPGTGIVVSASFSGGPGGTTARPSPAEESFARERHVPPTHEQIAHVQAAARNPALTASVNQGRPAIAATVRAGDFSHNVIGAREAGPRNLEAEQRNQAVTQNHDLAKGGSFPQHAPPGQPPTGQPHAGEPHAGQPHPGTAPHPENGEGPHAPHEGEPNNHHEGPQPGEEHHGGEHEERHNGE